jgi:uncharacterized membrane protein YbaN (DUF454 family)/phosphohistidine swiveling domain-containing protein
LTGLKRSLAIAAGTVCIALGVIGMFVPLLPTTPLLLLGAALYLRSSQRLYDWLMRQKYLGTYIRNYREGKGIPLFTKVATLVLLWATISYSALVAIDSLVVRVVLFGIAVGVTVHLLKLPTLHRDSSSGQGAARPFSACVLPLGSRRTRSAASVGGKAAGLVWVQRLGHPVPRAFVITPRALQDHLRASGALPGPKTGHAEETLHLIRETIAQAPIPRRIARAIAKAYQRLGGTVAVRSSALVEDTAEASCAGQLRTVLEVYGEEAVTQAVRACWQSLYTDSLLEYLCERCGMDRERLPTELRMGVIVQRMVDAEASGVAFTADPMTGERHFVVEAARGLGERVVGGHVVPDRYALDSNGEVIEATIAEGEPVLDGVVLSALALPLRDIGRKAEHPQDVEWAWDGRRVWVLQSRPITSLIGKRIYSSRLVSEMSPGLIKPLVWSVNTKAKLTNVIGRLFTEMLGPNDIDFRQMCRLFYSRLYLDAGMFGDLLHRVGLPRNVIEMMLYGEKGDARPRMRPSPRMLGAMYRMGRVVSRHGRSRRQTAEFLSRHDRDLEPFRQADWPSADPTTLMEASERLMHLHGESQWYTFICAMNMVARSALMHRLLTRWQVEVDAGELVRGLAGMKGLEPSARLQELAGLARGLDHNTLERLTVADDQTLRAALSGDSMGRQLLDGFDDYLGDYGFLNSNGTDFSRVPWGEDPELIWRAIGRAAQHPEGGKLPDLQSARETARKQVLSQLGPLKRWLFDRLLDSTCAHIRLKEHGSLMMSEDSYHMRRLSLALAGHLGEFGVLDDRDDVFYLEYEEIKQSLVDGLPAHEARELIAVRKAQLEMDAAIEPPQVICGEERAALQPTRSTSARTLGGIAGSPGRAEGRARIVMDPSEAPVDLALGDILVVPFTDVGWTPLFTGVSGLVAETGGQLSHSAIVAREYGLPAVVSVRRATQLIREYQPLGIDGTRGTVELG